MIINTTPHSINLPGLVIPPSGAVVRVAVTLAEAGTYDGVALVRGTYGEVTGLPPQQDGVVYVVSALVRAALPHRKDLSSPAKLTRDEKGNITGCEALEIN